MSTAHLLNFFLPLSSVQLGRLVLNAKKPHQEFIDPLTSRPSELELTRNAQTGFKETRKYTKSSNLRSRLSNLAHLSFEQHELGVATLKAPHATTHELQNSGNWFKEACKQEETRRFLEEAIDNSRTVYLVVGFHTVRGAEFIERRLNKKGRMVKCETPIPLAIGGAIAAGIAMNAAAGAVYNLDGENGQDLGFETPDEQIFAVLYRKVRFNWFSSRNLDKAFLEAGNRWKSFWDWRGPSADEGEEDDVIEAELVDDEDLEISDDEYLSEDDIDSPKEETSGLANTEGVSGELAHQTSEIAGNEAEKTSNLTDKERTLEKVHTPHTSDDKTNSLGGENSGSAKAEDVCKDPAISVKQKTSRDNTAKITQWLRMITSLISIFVFFVIIAWLYGVIDVKIPWLHAKGVLL